MQVKVAEAQMLMNSDLASLKISWNLDWAKVLAKTAHSLGDLQRV